MERNPFRSCFILIGSLIEQQLFIRLFFFQVCPTEIIAFSDHIEKFKSIDCEVVGVSTDSHFSHLAWINLERKRGGLGGLNYPLLSDFSRKISDNYGVLIPDAGIALRGLFIIDPTVSITYPVVFIFDSRPFVNSLLF